MIRAALLAACLALVPRAATADWIVAGYVGASRTPPRTLRVTPAGGSPFGLPDVDFRGEAFRSPIYYGYRIGWQPDGSRFGLEAEFTHAKTIAVDTHSLALTHFEMSHGLNFVLANAVYRSSPVCGGRCTLVARGGAGITIPHVEATYLDRQVSAYQFGGPAAQGGLGLEVALSRGLLVVADARVTYTHVAVDVPDARVTGGFTTWHVNTGIGWRFR